LSSFWGSQLLDLQKSRKWKAMVEILIEIKCQVKSNDAVIKFTFSFGQVSFFAGHSSFFDGQLDILQIIVGQKD
jgi:hypothetical protein